METLENTQITEQVPEKPEKKKKGIRALVAITWVLSILVTAALTVLIVLFLGKQDTVTVKEAMDIIRGNFYFYDQEQDGLTEGAIRGMTQSLGDVYSTYYSEEEYAALTQSNSGFYSGIGIVLQQEDVGSFVIVQVYSGTPAQEAGLLAGDYMLELNGTSAEGIDLDTFLKSMHSGDGEENKIRIRRGEEELEFLVTAREIYAQTVTYRMQTDSIGYIHLSGFHGDCVTEVKEAVEELREQGMESLIFDVRDNPGGSLYDVCDIADLFLPKDVVITSLRSRTERQQDYKTTKEGYTFPMVLLVNANSASASELLSGALQDHGRAYVIGTKTYGKGIVQSYFPVAGTGGYIKITTEAYYTPNGVCIQGVGITPDETVEQGEEGLKYGAPHIPEEVDVQLSRAIAHLEANQTKE